MKDKDVKKLEISMERLKELHELAINHQFRVHRTGSHVEYVDLLDELGEVFYALVKKSFEHSDIPYPWYPVGRWVWPHQYWSCVRNIRSSIDTQTSEYLETAEHYLNTMHVFLNTGKLESFYMHLGYSTYDKTQHRENPMRSPLFVYYPQLKRWDMTKFWAKQELPYKLRKVREDMKMARKHRDTDSRKLYDDMLKWSKKRVAELREVINA